MKKALVIELVVAAVLIVASGALFFGANYANNYVHDQLAAQKIFFPPKGSAALSPKEFPDLQKYAGQQVVNGEQARAYANGFINRHLQAAAGGKTYSQVSAASLANPKDTKLAATVQTLFRGETLRGLLLNAWGWWLVGQIAFFAAIGLVSLGGLALVSALVTVLAMRRHHVTETVEDAVIAMPPLTNPSPA